MKTIIKDFVKVKSDLLRYFNCGTDYHITPLLGCEWFVKQDEGVAILCYWKGAERVEAVVARKDGEAQIFRKKDYTMVVAIDCIKIAFVVDSTKEK